MRIVLALFAASLVGACAHADVALSSGSSAQSGVTSASAGLQVDASGSLAAVLAAGVIVAAAASEPDDGASWPRYRSIREWFSGAPAPELDPTRSVTEQDCTKPIQGSGNLKCR